MAVSARHRARLAGNKALVGTILWSEAATHHAYWAVKAAQRRDQEECRRPLDEIANRAARLTPRHRRAHHGMRVFLDRRYGEP